MERGKDRFWLLNGIPYGDGEREGQVLAIERDPLRGCIKNSIYIMVYKYYTLSSD